jgi:hypothetical protein
MTELLNKIQEYINFLGNKYKKEDILKKLNIKNIYSTESISTLSTDEEMEEAFLEKIRLSTKKLQNIL